MTQTIFLYLDAGGVYGKIKQRKGFHFMNRIQSHPILEIKPRKTIRFIFEGQPMEGLEGDSVASALIANGLSTFAHSHKHKRPRGFYCAIGNCASCEMSVNGKEHVRTCITPLEENMDVKRSFYNEDKI